MIEDNGGNEVQLLAVRLVLKHGHRASSFAAMIAQELSDMGDLRESDTWSAVAHASARLLDDLLTTPVERIGHSAGKSH